MEKYNITLVVFTWLTQASVGLIILRSVYLRISSGTDIKIIRTGTYTLLTAFVLLVTGLLFSFGHLHYPGHAYNAINNTGNSWMSREILAEIIFLFIVLLSYIINRFGIKIIPSLILEVLAILSGMILIYFMIRTYMLPSLPELNHPSFPLSFILTPLIAGAAILYLFTRKTEPGMALKFKILFSILFIFSFVNHIIFLSFHGKLLAFKPVTLVYLATSIISLPSLYATLKNKNVTSDVIFLNLALICDFLNRVYAFTYTNPAL